MANRCCDRCGAPLVKPATYLEMTHRSARGVERDVRLLCLECAAAIAAYLQRRPEVSALGPPTA